MIVYAVVLKVKAGIVFLTEEIKGIEKDKAANILNIVQINLQDYNKPVIIIVQPISGLLLMFYFIDE